MFSSKTLKKIQATLIFMIVCSSIAFSAQLVIDQVGVYTTPQAMIQAIDDNFDELYARWTSLVDDTTPQLGGDLDLNTHSITGMVIGTNIQAYDADLTTWAGITPGSNVGTFLATPSSANFFSAISDEGAYASTLFGLSAATGLPIGDTAFTDLSNGSTYTNFGIAGDDTIDELFAAVDVAIGGLAGGHDAVTLDASLSSIFNLGGAQVLTLTAWPTFNQNTTGSAGTLTGDLDPDQLSGDSSDDNLIDQSIIYGLSTDGTASPGFTAYDSDSPGTDKTAGFIGWQYIDGADGAENSDWLLQIMQSGSLVEVLRFDESDDRLEIPTGKHFAIGTIQWDNGSDYIDGAAIEDNGIPAAKVASVMKTEGFSITLGNGSDAITTGTKWTKTVCVPFKHDLTSIEVSTNETAGSLTIDTWIDEKGATTGLSEIADADSLFDTASEPAIADASSDNTISITSFDSGEATDIPAGTCYVTTVDAASTLTYANVSYALTRKD